MYATNLDVELYKKMISNGLGNMRLHESYINNLNVFPVPDGDTGTNMRMTLQNGVSFADHANDIGEYSLLLAKGMLFGARGNSGVILSQIFKGIGASLTGKTKASAKEYADALINGYKVAYNAVVHPVEGTILTVARLGIENIHSQITENSTVNDLLRLLVKSQSEVLEKTPDMLPVLKEAGVIDSGGQGLLTIFEGMCDYLSEKSDDALQSDGVSDDTELDFDLFGTDSVLKFGYCLDFIMRLQSSKCNPDDFSEAEFASCLEASGGNSIVATKDGSLLKVHVHTMRPAPVFELVQKYGEILKFKLDDMDLESSTADETQSCVDDCNNMFAEHKDIAYVVVAQGEGMVSLFKELGADVIIEGGDTMNPSVDSFVRAILHLNADSIIIAPNNKDTISAALQACELVGTERNVFVLKTRSVIEGYYAMSLAIGDRTNGEEQFNRMEKAICGINTLKIGKAMRDTSVNGVECKSGQCISLLNEDLIYCGQSESSVIEYSLDRVENLDDCEVIMVISGCGLSGEACDEIVEMINDKYPDKEVGVVDGGQKIYDVIIGIF